MCRYAAVKSTAAVKDECVTGPDGVYHMEGILHGEYSLYAAGNGTYDEHRATIKVKNDVLPGGDADLDMSRRGLRLSGVTHWFDPESTKTPVGGAKVRAIPEGALAGHVPEVHAVTSPDGTYTVLLKVGTWRLEASHPEAKPPEFEMPLIEMAEDSTSNFGLDRKTYVVSGTVKSAGSRSCGGFDSPIEGARVAMSGLPGGVKVDAVTDADGKYALEGIPAGVYPLVAAAEGHVSDATRDSVSVTGGVDVAGVDPTLAVVTHGLQGTVVEYGTFSPMPRQPLEAYLLPAEHRGSGAESFPLVTDDRGAFALKGLVPGTYRLTASREHYAPLEVDVKVLTWREVGEGQDTVLEPDAAVMKKRPYPIGGRVMSKVTKAPLAGALVKLLSGGGIGVGGASYHVTV